ncbi:MAG: hypothetical protein L6Q37_00570 [Bdellovibrionaceae bacterium]|nr:hypothetical protein [Pseudobdellovibrionaceae bacterium]NUM57636.1 hypothetical protein [Pseudobdellovibrionaceae bacterium]
MIKKFSVSAKVVKSFLVLLMISMNTMAQAKVEKEVLYGDVTFKQLSSADIYTSVKRTDVVIYGYKIEDFQEIMNIFAVALAFKQDKLMDLTDLKTQLKALNGTDKKFEVSFGSAAYLDINSKVGAEKMKDLLEVLNQAQAENFNIQIIYLQ